MNGKLTFTFDASLRLISHRIASQIISLPRLTELNVHEHTDDYTCLIYFHLYDGNVITLILYRFRINFYFTALAVNRDHNIM